MKNFQRGGMGEVLKFVRLNFKIFFGLNDLFWAAQNVHKISIKSTGGHKLNY